MNDAKQWRESVANEIHDAVRAANGNISYGAITDALFAKVPVLAAAPDLLEALQRCATLMKNGFIPPENIGKDAEEIVSGDYANGWDAACEEFRNSRTAEIAQAAIAKAEGRS